MFTSIVADKIFTGFKLFEKANSKFDSKILKSAESRDKI
jgi:hypothetical protein